MAGWPEPADLPVDRARRIANTLLAHLPDDLQADMIRQARLVGETWLGAELLRWTVDDVLPPAEAAGIVHVTPAHLRAWIRLGVLTRTGHGYRAGDVLDASAEVRRRRAARKRPLAQA